ncbi:hypothetical protein [Streptomyces sp. PH10-H1]|uniref:hypothetical protein n=1 Tax=Streptomyces sp. PH10-H1 TaxID=3046212 RepID=UPI0024BA5A08|nr:hypothetical protein [Streptomyces sp. PH10-H1]MDJ0341787.1 hypothetical protein [Streptomyces sp. PH10-H1]
MTSPRTHPRIIVAVRGLRGPYRQKLDLTGRDAAATNLPGIKDGGRVCVDVADGLRVEDLAVVTAFALSVRNAGVLEIIGRSRRAVDRARAIFIDAWKLDVDITTPEHPERASATRWAALFLGTVREEDRDR